MTVVEASDLFTDPGRPQRLFGHIETLIRGLVKNDKVKVSDISVVTDAEKRSLIFDWNPTSSFPSHDTSCPE